MGIFWPIQKATGEIEQVVTTPPSTSQSTTSQTRAITGVPLAPHDNLPGNLLASPGCACPSKIGAPDDQSAQPASNSGDENAVPVRVVTPESPIAAMWEYLQTALGPLATASVVVVLIIFMLLGREDLRDRIIRLFGHGQLNLTTQAIDEVAHRITRYLVAQSLVNICYGLAVSGGLWVIGRLLGHGSGGFPNVLLWGIAVHHAPIHSLCWNLDRDAPASHGLLRAVSGQFRVYCHSLRCSSAMKWW